jgi:hypothetical protein
MNQNFMKYASNPKGFTIKKWLAELLENKYTPFDDLIERIGMSLVTDNDLQSFGKLVTTIYESGYLRAMNQCKKNLDDMGIKVKVVPADQSLKSGEMVEGEHETRNPPA